MKMLRALMFVTLILLAGLANLRAQEILINEFLAANSSTNTDTDGEFSDWLELYNAGSSTVDLAGYTLTDNLGLPAQWALPSVILPPNGLLLIWASGKNRTSGELHTNFKLGAGGEFLGLFSPSGQAVDTLTFGPQTDDISQARIADGTGAFTFSTTPTPGTTNNPSPDTPNIVINEFLAGNSATNVDEDGEASDWVELYNFGAAAVNLNGFTIPIMRVCPASGASLR